MTTRRGCYVAILICLALIDIYAISTSSASSPQFAATVVKGHGPNGRRQETQKTTEQTYKNIQVLKGLPSGELFDVMNFITVALGVNCDNCHVDSPTGDLSLYYKDDKALKRRAREMMLMMRRVNQETFGGKTVVNCVTCHQGRLKPSSVPALLSDVPTQIKTEADKTKPPEVLPPAEEIVDKYVTAVGGKAAFEKLKTRTIRATLLMISNQTRPQEIFMAAPNKAVVMTTTSRGIRVQGFNGAVGWTQTPTGHIVMRGRELELFMLAVNFAPQIRLRELSKELILIGKEKIGEREVYLIHALPNEGAPERLYFEIQSGLLIRRTIDYPSPFGAIPCQFDIGDYRQVDGVKLPFFYQRLGPWTNWIQRISEIKHNVPIDENKFNPPKTKAVMNGE